jgi:hypothetical protein
MMDAVTELFLILLVLSGIFAIMGLATLVIERWPTLAAGRPRRAPARIRCPPRRGRGKRPRRLPHWVGRGVRSGDR